MIDTTVSKNGIVVLDEPELHLNPALCRRLLPFMIEEYLVPVARQALICSHSPEILASAYDDPQCRLFNLVSPRRISQILGGDQDELYAALETLGANLEDILFSKGTIYVEGDDDKRLLSEGFGERLSRFRVVHMKGRDNIEREIKNIQKADGAGKISTLHFFIFDMDRKPTELTDTEHVKVLQWNRRAIENFLLDDNAIFDLIKGEDVSSARPPERRGDVLTDLKALAMSQIDELAILEVYNAFEFDNLGLRPKDARNKPISQVTNDISRRLLALKERLGSIQSGVWEKELEALVSSKIDEIQPLWERDWKKLCDAKRALVELHQKYGLKISMPLFKRRILREMKRKKSPFFVDLTIELEPLLASAKS